MKSKKIKAILGLLLIVAALVVHSIYNKTELPIGVSQTRDNTKMTPKEMQEDIDYLVSKLKSVHPATINGVPKNLQSKIHEVKLAIAKPLTLNEFYFQVNSITKQLNDAHTSVRYLKNNDSKQLILPIRWLKKSIVVEQGTAEFRLGDEIVELGGKTTTDILQMLQKFIPAENKDWVRALAQKLIRDEIVLRHLGLIDTDNTVQITYKRDSKHYSVKLPLVDANTVPYIPKQDWVYTKFYEDHSLAIFRFDECSYNEEFKIKLKKFFTEVANKNIKHVAFDVRNNSGGKSQVIDEILQYLALVKEVKSYGALVRFSEDATKMKSYIKTTTGFKQYLSSNNAINHNPSQELFKGNVYILTSNRTFSSANWLAVMAYDNQFAMVIGEPTGNAPTSFGDVLKFYLPNSGYKLRVSHKKFTRPNQKNDPATSLVPHKIVYTVAEDIKEGRDAQLETLFKIIAENK